MIDKSRALFVDLDSTLAMPTKGPGFPIGLPNPKVAARLTNEIRNGRDVVLFTARASDGTQIPVIKDWLAEHGFPDLRITNVKDQTAGEIWDDKAIGINPATSDLVTEPGESGPAGVPKDVALEISVKLGRGVDPRQDRGQGMFRGAFADTMIQKRKGLEAKNNLKTLEKAKAGKPTAPVASTPLVKYKAKDDKKTRPEHEKLDGKIMPANSLAAKSKTPPADGNCRCEVVPVKKTKKPIDTTVSKDFYHQMSDTENMTIVPEIKNGKGKVITEVVLGGAKVEVPVPDPRARYESYRKELEKLASADDLPGVRGLIGNISTFKEKLNGYLEQAKNNANKTSIGDHSIVATHYSSVFRELEGLDERAKVVEKNLKDAEKKAASDAAKKTLMEQAAAAKSQAPANKMFAELTKYITEDNKLKVDEARAVLRSADVEKNPDKKATLYRQASEMAADITAQGIGKKTSAERDMKWAIANRRTDLIRESFGLLTPEGQATALLQNPKLTEITGATFGDSLSKIPGLRRYQKDLVAGAFQEKLPTGQAKYLPQMIGTELSRMVEDNARIDASLAAKGVIDTASVPDKIHRIMSARMAVAEDKDSVAEREALTYAKTAAAEKARTDEARNSAANDPRFKDVKLREDTLKKTEKAGVESAYTRADLRSRAAAVEASIKDLLAKSKVPLTKTRGPREKPEITALRNKVAQLRGEADALLARADRVVSKSPDERAFEAGTATMKANNVDALKAEGLDEASSEEAYSLGYTKKGLPAAEVVKLFLKDHPNKTLIAASPEPKTITEEEAEQDDENELLGAKDALFQKYISYHNAKYGVPPEASVQESVHDTIASMATLDSLRAYEMTLEEQLNQPKNYAGNSPAEESVETKPQEETT